MNEYNKNYLLRLESAGKISRFLKKKILFPFFLKNFEGTILDFGCGDLTFLKHARATVPQCQLVAYDIIPDCQKLADLAQIEFYSSSEDLKSAGKFDLIICDNVLEHIEDWRGVLRELIGFLPPGGTLIIGVPGTRGYTHDATHLNHIVRFDIDNFILSDGRIFLEERFCYPFIKPWFGWFFELFSRHVLFYYKLKRHG